MHHADTQRNRFVRIFDFCRFAFYFHLTRIGGVEAIQNRHQCGFTRTVLAHDAMNG